jgi:hypothetical protein
VLVAVLPFGVGCGGVRLSVWDGGEYIEGLAPRIYAYSTGVHEYILLDTHIYLFCDVVSVSWPSLDVSLLLS